MSVERKRILYVDDDADDRDFFSGAVREVNPDVEVIEAENGLKALEYLNAVKNAQLPCLIVLDINMPFLDGRETLRRIKMDATLISVPVIILSSSEKPNDKIFFNQQGVEYFTKPTNISYLTNIASYLVGVCCH